ncbi:hypothetical protein A6P39_001890 [Streptomyces sp. FXJ1.172]|nr:hypothetical protein [Streptomyces sp. FXJ1.172]WEP00494.1 hypothetical protein A6P39_001890 [Streptomyces sp. FXJ1.172]
MAEDRSLSGTLTWHGGAGTAARPGPATTPGAPLTVNEAPSRPAVTGTV